VDDGGCVLRAERWVRRPRERAAHALAGRHVQVESQRVGAVPAREQEPRRALRRVKVAAVDHNAAALRLERLRARLLARAPAAERILRARLPRIGALPPCTRPADEPGARLVHPCPAGALQHARQRRLPGRGQADQDEHARRQRLRVHAAPREAKRSAASAARPGCRLPGACRALASSRRTTAVQTAAEPSRGVLDVTSSGCA
jgi:hypothetical protein